MKKIPFSKLTSFGNNFVVLDESDRQFMTEDEKQHFAYYATNCNFGIGCDNFLVVQRCSEEVLNGINAANRYWDRIPDTAGADLIFRMFEPDGTEAFSCGNGLMCIARYLFNSYGTLHARILTKIPTSHPGVVTIGREPDGTDFFANLGAPQRMDATLADRTFLTPLDESIDLIENLDIRQFRATDAIRFFNSSAALSLRGYLVFTGEPHLVILSDNGFSLPEPPKHIFPTSFEESCSGRFSHRRISTGSELVNFIGYYFVKNYSHIFPKGININFVRKLPGENILEYRCFERGINKETLACGTGALACAFVMRSLEKVDADDIRLWPYLCRMHKHGAELRVKKIGDGWQIFGQPSLLYEGLFTLQALPAPRTSVEKPKIMEYISLTEPNETDGECPDFPVPHRHDPEVQPSGPAAG